MSKSSKAKIDKPARLRKKAHLGTIQKNDHLRPDSVKEGSVENRLLVLEEAIRVCWDYIHLLYWAMNRSGTGNTLETETYACPRCQGKLIYDEDKVTHICKTCGHKFSIPSHWCYNCLSTAEFVWSDEIDDPVCPRCGAKRH